MDSWRRLFLLTLVTTAIAQDSALCNSSIANANASGIKSYNPGIAPTVSWALTVGTGSDGTAESNLWYSAGGQDYSDDLSLGYDVCAFFISDLPVNTIRLGQSASNDCSGMLTSKCMDTLLTRASESAFGYVQNPSPPPYSNLSAGVLPTLCSYIMSDLSGGEGTTWPHECQKEFGEVDSTSGYVGATINSVALTGYNESGLSSDCELQSNSRTFNLAPYIDAAGAAYDNATRSVYPILSIYFPVANVDRTSTFASAPSFMTCLRVDDFAEGSRVSPSLPSGTPYHYGSGLRGGAIAGIVVGVLTLVGIVAGVAIWWFLRRRRQRRQAATTANAKDGFDSLGAPKGNELDGDDVYELKPDDRKPEMGEEGVYELSPEDKKAELSPESQRHELPGAQVAELESRT